MSIKILYLNFEFLRGAFLPDREMFIKTVEQVVESKYSDTGVEVVWNEKLARMLETQTGASVKEVFVHDQPFIDASPDGLGCAATRIGGAEVDITDFSPDLPSESLARQVGTVAAHEGGHLFLPTGHSIDAPNLMSEGPLTYERLEATDGEGLDFTEAQKCMLRGEMPPFGSLGESEQSWWDHIGANSESLGGTDASSGSEIDDPDDGGGDDLGRFGDGDGDVEGLGDADGDFFDGDGGGFL